MKKYVRTPEDPVLPGSVYAEKVWPGVHKGPRASKIYVAPEREFADYNLGNIGSQRIQFVVAHNGPNSETLVHAHPDQEQVDYVVSGQVAIRNGDQEIQAGPGHSVFTPPATDHGYRNPFPGWMTLLDLHSYQYPDVPPSKLRVTRVSEGPGGFSGELKHLDREEVYYVLVGNGRFTVHGEEIEAAAGDIVYIPRSAPHSYSTVGDAPLELVAITSYDVPSKVT